MKAALLKRLQRLEEVQATENLPPPEFQIGYLKELPPDYTGERHIVTVSRDPDGKYWWEERPGPAPDEGIRNLPPPFRVIIQSDDDVLQAPEA